jgi:hypothetical protein
MKKPIIEIEELGSPNSLIYRKDAQISEIVNTEKMLEELNEQLRLHDVVGRSEQLKAYNEFVVKKLAEGWSMADFDEDAINEFLSL